MKTMNTNLLRSRGTLALLAGIGLLLPAAQVKAQDDAYSLAPPVDYYNASANTNAVFNWQEVPQNQVVPVVRAVFDQGGYQIFDQSGETIVVPFQDQNLYAMKFAVSETGQTYFVNDAGQAPILYIPENGYLENATVPGARWYPFNQHFCPTRPVFLGIAPSYSEYISMGWYPHEVCSGGFYGDVSFVSGGFFGPTLGLTFIFGGQHYHGWDGYQEYASNYPAPYHVGWSHRDYYQFAGRPDFNRTNSFSGFNGQTQYPGSSRPTFGGGNNGFGNGGFGGRGQNPSSTRPTFGGGGRQPVNQGNSPFGTRPTFGGGTTSRPTFGGGETTRPTFGGTTSRPTFGGMTNRPTFGGTTASRPTFGSGTTSRPTFGGGTTTSRPTFGGASNRPSFGGETASRPSFGGNDSRPSFGGTTASRPNFGGNDSRPSFGGNTSRSTFGNQNLSRTPVFTGSQPSRDTFGGSSFQGAGRSESQSRPSFGGTQSARGNSSFGGGQTPRSNGGSFPTARSNEADRTAPRSNDNSANSSSSRSFPSASGNRGFNGR